MIHNGKIIRQKKGNNVHVAEALFIDNTEKSGIILDKSKGAFRWENL